MDPLPTPLDEKLLTLVLLRLKTAPTYLYVYMHYVIHNIRTYVHARIWAIQNDKNFKAHNYMYVDKCTYLTFNHSSQNVTGLIWHNDARTEVQFIA